MSVLLLPAVATAPQPPDRDVLSVRKTAARVALLVALSALVFLIHGYHPYSQDAAIYVAGIEKGISPSLYSTDAVFVEGHAHLSVFSHVLSFIARDLHVPLDALLLIAYLATVALFLAACYRLATRIFSTPRQIYGATALAAACFTMPVTATALLLMDPYLTARSFSTPFSLLAIIACLDRSWMRTSLWLVLAVAMHPLMGIYLFAFLAMLALLDRGQWIAAVSLASLGFLLSAFISLFTRHIVVSDAYREAALSRSYFFLASWHWYEIVGLLAPLALMAFAAKKCGLRSTVGKLCSASVLVGSVAFLSSLLFVHPSHPDLLMRLQVLRSFHIIYAIGLVMIGGFVFSHFRNRATWIGVALFLVALAATCYGDHLSYPASTLIEWPGKPPANAWEQAFLWIRNNTPQNAVFAADSSALNSRGEDAQGFRALSERSTLNDNKDEGVVSLFPADAAVWRKRRNAELGLNQENDRERLDRLRPYGVTWILLSPAARTSFDCPYRNPVVAVCRLSPQTPAS